MLEGTSEPPTICQPGQIIQISFGTELFHRQPECHALLCTQQEQIEFRRYLEIVKRSV
jgi:hypothetical protein